MIKRILLFAIVILGFSWTTAHAAERVDLPLSFEPIQLYGPTSEHTMYYTIEGQAESANLELILTHSTELIEPSAITVEIDGELVATRALQKGADPKLEWSIPLQDSMKKHGTHTVRVKFNGVILQGVCVDQQTTSNWMMVHLQSHVQLNGYERHYTKSLKNWTEEYTPMVDEVTAIVIPTKTSASVQSAAMRLRAHLAQLATQSKQVVITTDPAVGNQQIIVGLYDEFDDPIRERLESVERIEGEMQLGRIDERFAYALADDAEQLEQLLPVLYDETWRKQLSQERLSIGALPEKNNAQTRFTFSELNIAPVILDSVTTESAKYILSLPYALPMNGETTIQLQLQKSSLLEQNEEFGTNEQAELIVAINEFLYPVELKTNQENSLSEFIEVTIPNEQLMRDSKFTLQLKSNGLRVNDPCISTDRNLWVQIDPKQSAIQFANGAIPTDAVSFSRYPYPFAYEETVVVLPSWTDVSEEAIDTLVQRFHLNDSMTYFRTADEVEESLKQNAHVIFIQPHHYLEAEQLDFKIVEERWQSAAFGFLEGTEDFVLTAKASPWNAEKQAFYIDTMRPNIASFHWIDRFVQDQRESTHAIVNTVGTIIYEGHHSANNESVVKEKTNEWPLFFIGFGLLILLLVGGIIILAKRRKKRG